MFEKMKETKDKVVANVKEHGPEVGKKCLAVIGGVTGVAGLIGFGVVLAKVAEECNGAGKPWAETVQDMRVLDKVETVANSKVRPDDSVDIYEKVNLPENWVEIVNQAKEICLIVSKETID